VILRETCQVDSRENYAMTAKPSIDPARFLHGQLESASPDLLRSLLTTFLDALMSAEADAVCGAPYGMVSPERVNVRNAPWWGRPDIFPGVPVSRRLLLGMLRLWGSWELQAVLEDDHWTGGLPQQPPGSGSGSSVRSRPPGGVVPRAVGLVHDGQAHGG
jgi:Transposase, Mutator family